MEVELTAGVGLRTNLYSYISETEVSLIVRISFK